MKKLLLFFFISYGSFGQIFTPSSSNSFITITPKGLDASDNTNIGVGRNALLKNNGNFNSAFGHQSLGENINGVLNSALGAYALSACTSCWFNTAIGAYALTNNQEDNNTAIGAYSLYSCKNCIYSTAVGVNALYSNIGGDENVAIGYKALYADSIGNYNTSIGSYALMSNKSGNMNTAVGRMSMPDNTIGTDNVALGSNTLLKNKTGNGNVSIGGGSLSKTVNSSYNIGIGQFSLFENTTGAVNTAIGIFSMQNNTTGETNTAIGSYALASNITGGSNVGIGSGAGYQNKYGNRNTFIGADSGITENTFIVNSTAIGSTATVNESNKVRIGNAQVKVIEGQVPWSNPSDRRLKENILYTNRLGLNFITRLQTVSYNYISDENKTRHDGFIAQDVEKVMQELGIPFSGLKKSSNGTYSLAYSDFVMPLVNAVKEQQKQIEELKRQNQTLSARLSEIDEIKAEIARMKARNQSESSK